MKQMVITKQERIIGYQSLTSLNCLCSYKTLTTCIYSKTLYVFDKVLYYKQTLLIFFLHQLAYKSCRKAHRLVSILPRNVNNTKT